MRQGADVLKIRHDVEALDKGQLDFMWNFLRMGRQRSNVPALKSLCERLRQAMIQKDGGQRGTTGNVDFRDVGTIVNSIVIETMCLYLSGDLDRLEKLGGEQEGDRRGG